MDQNDSILRRNTYVEYHNAHNVHQLCLEIVLYANKIVLTFIGLYIVKNTINKFCLYYLFHLEHFLIKYHEQINFLDH